MIDIESENRSGIAVSINLACDFARSVLLMEGINEGELGLWFVSPREIRSLKLKHLGIDEATDVLSFPIDGGESLPEGVPRVLGDVFICPQVVENVWRSPLAHGLLHLLGYGHGDLMEKREQELLAQI